MKWWWIGVVLVLAGCSTTQVAPVIDGANYKNSNAKRAAAASKVRDWRPATYIVAKGDTLYSIALEYGLDYRELSGWNKLSDVNRIYVGQTLRLTEPTQVAVAVKDSPQTSAMSPAVVTTQPLLESVNITQPLALKLPYSEQAVAQLNQPKSDSQPVVSNSSVLSSKPLPAPPPPVVKDIVKDVAPKEADDTALDWMWPAQGKTIAEFSEAQSSKGIDIAGTAGQPIYAAAAGKVVYSGSGLRGYGKLVIIKHNAIYLSAYAHNQTVLVKEGQSVQRGQKVAEMGNTDADQVKLHFEIRQMGKPVDPMKYLPEAGK